MSERPVAHVIVSGDLVGVTADPSQLAELRQMNNAPLYSQSPAEARALAIAECAEFCESLDPTLRPYAVAERIRARFGMEQNAPEIFPGTMDALNSLGVRK